MVDNMVNDLTIVVNDLNTCVLWLDVMQLSLQSMQLLVRFDLLSEWSVFRTRFIQ